MIIFFQKKMLIIENNPYYFKSIASNNYFKMVVKFIRGIKISINKSGKERMVDIIFLAFGFWPYDLNAGQGCFCFFGIVRLHQIDNNNNNIIKIKKGKKKKIVLTWCLL